MTDTQGQQKQWLITDYETIQQAVEACAAEGGGTVVIPAGEWHTGSIHLKSNVHLHLREGARVVFSSCREDYLPVVFTRWEGMECYNYSPLIYANGCENISVTGRGTLFGNGQDWWSWKKLQQAAANELCYAQSNNIPPEQRIYGTEQAALRPSFIQTIHCKNVLLEGFTIEDGPQWTLHPVYCENVTVRNVTVSTHGPNTDGLNPDSCCGVLVENCVFDTGDDCIAVNAGMNEDGWRVGRPCKDIEIRNCTMNGGHGAIVIGSAVSGGVENVYAHHCKISGTDQGIRMKSMRGRGGYVENVRFSHLEMQNVLKQAVQITMFYESSTVQPKSDTPSRFDRIFISGLSGDTAGTGLQIRGLPESNIGELLLEDICLEAQNAMECSDAGNLTLRNVVITKKQLQPSR